MKYIFRFIQFILFCLWWIFLPICWLLANFIAVIWYFNKPPNGWFKLENYDWYWDIDGSKTKSGTILIHPTEYYANPIHLLINNKSKYQT